MKIIRQYTIVIILLCCGQHSYAVNFDLLIKTVELSADISAEKINVIYSDSSGYLWLGTKNGLYRWDGAKAIYYENKEGSENVTTIKHGPKGTIWVGYQDGSIAYTENRMLVSFQIPQYSNDSSSITDILFDSNGRIWWSTYGSGLYCYSKGSLAPMNTSNGLNDNFIYDLEFGVDKRVWVATDNGVNICYVDSLTNNLVPLNFPEKLPDLIVLRLVKDHEGFMWFGFHQGGIYYFKPFDSTFHEITPIDVKSFGRINALTIEKKDIWILDDNNGLFFSKHPHNNNLEPVRFKGAGINEGIRSVISDCHGNLYILTKKNLFISNGLAIVVTESINDKNSEIHSIVSTSPNEYWMTTNSNLIKMDNDSVHTFLENKLNYSSSFTSIAADHTGKIWIGTLGQGIIFFNPDNGTYSIVDRINGLIDDNVLSINFKDKTIWVATLGGLSAIILNDKSQIKNIRSFKKEHGLTTNFIYTVFPDSKGRIWFGSDGNGLLKLENDVFYVYNEDWGINDKNIYSITEDRSGNIWFSTSNSLIYKYNGSVFEKFEPGELFSGRYIYSLATEGDHIFILTDEGLNIFNSNTGEYACLNEELGFDQIISDLNSVCTNDHSICFATHDKIIKIDRDLINRYSIHPYTSLDQVSVNLEAVSQENNQTFSANDNRFVFEYSGSWPLAPNKIQYIVKLDGYDPDWKNTYDKTAIYPNLSPGKYTFMVKAFLNKKVIDAEMTTFTFTIRKPFYLSIWFIVLNIISLIAIITWFVRSREKRLKQIEAKKKEKLEFEFQTLKNQVNPHFLFNSFSTLISIIDENPEDAITYTEALSGFFRDILEVKDQPLIPLNEELQMMSNYTTIHQRRKGNNFMVEIYLDDSIKKTKIPPLTLQLLAENALKHNIIGKHKPLTVTIKNTDKTIIVENNKRLKKQTAHSTGIGLKNISERYKLISGKEIDVEETSEYFRVILPIIK